MDMGTTDGTAVEEPLLRPRLVRFLKERRRLVDFGMREEFFDELERQIAERRTPSRVAEKTADEAFNRTRESATPVVRDRVAKRMEKANKNLLSNL